MGSAPLSLAELVQQHRKTLLVFHRLLTELDQRVAALEEQTRDDGR